MKQWAKQTFPSGIDGFLLIYNETDLGAVIYVDPTLFSSASFSAITITTPTYAALASLPIAQQGWKKIFDQWKTNGMVA